MEVIQTTTTTTTTKKITTPLSTTQSPTIRFNWNAWTTPDTPVTRPREDFMWNRWNNYQPENTNFITEIKTNPTLPTTTQFNWNTYNPNTFRTETTTRKSEINWGLWTRPSDIVKPESTTKFTWNAYNPDIFKQPESSSAKPENSWPMWTRPTQVEEKIEPITTKYSWTTTFKPNTIRNENQNKPETKWALWTRPMLEIGTEPTTKFAWYTYNPNTYRSETTVKPENVWPQWTRPTENTVEVATEKPYKQPDNNNNWPLWTRPTEIKTEPTTKLSWNTLNPDVNLNGQNSQNNPWLRPNTEQMWNNAWTNQPVTMSTNTFQQTTMTTTSAPTTSKKDYSAGGCTNFNDQICNHYSNLQLCRDTHFINGFPITNQCPKACGLC